MPVLVSWSVLLFNFTSPNLYNSTNWVPAKEYTEPHWGIKSLHIFHNHANRPRKIFVVMCWSYFAGGGIQGCIQHPCIQHLEQKLFVKEKQLLRVLLLHFPKSSISYIARNTSSLNRSRVTQGSVAPSAKKIAEESLYQALYLLNLLTSLLLFSSL